MTTTSSANLIQMITEAIVASKAHELELQRELTFYKTQLRNHYQYKVYLPGKMTDKIQIKYGDIEIPIHAINQFLRATVKVCFSYPSLLQMEDFSFLVNDLKVASDDFSYELVEKPVTHYRIELLSPHAIGLIKLQIGNGEILPIVKRTALGPHSFTASINFKVDKILRKGDVKIFELRLHDKEYHEIIESEQTYSRWELTVA